MSWWPFSTPAPSARKSPTSDPLSDNISSSNASDRETGAQLNREQQADRDLESFLSSLESDASTTSTAQSPSTTQPTNHERIARSNTSTTTPETSIAPSTTTPPPPESRLTPTGDLDISPSALYPRTMSCRAAFDQAFYCQSLGGKFNDIYRYGSIQSCSEQWGAFWFCMRVRGLGDKERQEAISEYYRGREEMKKSQKGSSEDVWEIRTEAVKKAFWRDPDAVQGEEG